jgi:UDP-N-acetylglucosamine:LPS N-acetylglucosamine transferase
MRQLGLPLEYDVAVVLSGPEPQRTYLENILLEQAVTLPQRFLFVQGKTHAQGQYFISENVEVVAYLTTQALNQVLCASQYVVCRSGYSSIMDLAALGKKALLIPTPGQTEQEYLAARLQAQGTMPMQVQHQINLDQGLKHLAGFDGFNADSFDFDDFESFL